MARISKNIFLLQTVLMISAPGATLAAQETYFAATAGDLLNPDKIFESLKKNITIPISADQKIEAPTPENALKEASPKLQEVNAEIKNEVGIDFAKFIGWSAKILKVFFQTVVDLLELVSKALEPKK